MRIGLSSSWIILMLAACTKTPASITHAPLSKTTYADWTCEQLAAEQTRLSIASTLAPTRDEKSGAKTEKQEVAGQDLKSADEAVTLAMNEKDCATSHPKVAAFAQEPATKPGKDAR